MSTTSLKQMNDDEVDVEIVAESNKEKTFLLERKIF
jgi:lipocalin